MNSPLRRLAIVVSHPIQYYVPLYQRLAIRKDLETKVFYTWHAGDKAVLDRGFERTVAWDIPLTQGYEHELIENLARDPGTHHFFGLQNPSLGARVAAWRPDAVHLTGWGWWSHLKLMQELHRRGLPVLFRGDSHLLDGFQMGPRWWAKRALLRRVFSWPAVFLYVGQANRFYYEAFGVANSRLRYCPHSIDVARFSEPSEDHERQAAAWRRALGIAEDARVLLFAGKFERKKQPVALMRAILENAADSFVLVLVGGGELEEEVLRLAAEHPRRFVVLPFQNQSLMPVVYRLGDLFILPSSFGETWGLAVNEAMACGRPALVSSRVGCGCDFTEADGVMQFPWSDGAAMIRMVNEALRDRAALEVMSRRALESASAFDISRTECSLMEALRQLWRQ
jgi:glycosyltransferase involved in cell wall biosynthesis